MLYFILILVGLCLGSFAGASMWRLRARQLHQDKTIGEKVDDKEYESLKKLIKNGIIINCTFKLKTKE